MNAFIRLAVVTCLLLTMILSVSSCTSSSGKSFIPGIPGYEEKNKHVFVMKSKLVEISGIFYQPEGSIAAINDEDGKLFIIDLPRDSVATYKFGDKADYEDLVKTDSFYYILESNGNIHEVSIVPEITSKVFDFTSVKKVEFESLVWYREEKKLMLISKDHRKKYGGVAAFSFDLATRQFSDSPVFIIPMHDIYLKLEDYSSECKPSAAAFNPVTKKLFILASVGKVLLECTRDGKVEKAHKLNPSQFPQPEGITFSPDGDMYISNEGLEGKATILKFPYTRQDK